MLGKLLSGIRGKLETEENVIVDDLAAEILAGKEPTTPAIESELRATPAEMRDLFEKSLPKIIANVRAIREEGAALPPVKKLRARVNELQPILEKLGHSSNHEVLSFQGSENVPVDQIAEWNSARIAKVSKARAADDVLRGEYRTVTEQMTRHIAIAREIEMWLNFLPSRWPRTFPGARLIEIRYAFGRTF